MLLHVNVTGCAGCASTAGLCCVGAASVGGGAAAGCTVTLADFVDVPRMPVIVTSVFAVTADVATEKLAEVAPAGTSTIPGGDATRLVVDSVTVTPPAGAAALSSTVP